MSRTLILTAALLAAAPLAEAQTVYGVDGAGALAWEITSAPGGPCGAPNPFTLAMPYPPSVCPIPGPGPIPPGSFLGDIADDPLTDTYYVTDGFVIGQYAAGGPCGAPAPGTPLNVMPVALIGAGPLTGMGMDPTGLTTGGVPALWLTDGLFVWAVAPSPPGSCAPPVVVVPPCPYPSPTGSRLTDITVDPFSGTLWACDAAGFLHNFAPGCAPVIAPVPVTPGACGLGPGLTGIAFDTGTPNLVTGAGPAVYVTDGPTIAYIDPFTGFPAPPTFYTPVPCFPAPAFFDGLALSQHGVNYGAPRVSAKLKTFGQSTTPGPTFGLELSGAPAGSSAFLLLNFNFPGPGFFCPAVPGVGTKIWVDPTPPGGVFALGPVGPGCIPLPLPIPPGVPNGLELFAQVVLMSGPAPAVDATEGVAATIGLP